MEPGAFCLVTPLAAGAALLAIRASNADTRSGTIGLAGTACGVAAFIPALIGPMASRAGQPQGLAVFGLLTVLLAAAAVALGVWAMRVRRRDAGVHGSTPVAALLCGLANLLCGSGLLVSGAGYLALGSGNPWTWKSERHGFEVTVPTERWVIKPNPNVLAQFSGSRPPLAAIVAEVRPAGSDAEYETALAVGKRARAETPTTNTEERTGANPGGHPHWLYMGDVKSGGEESFFGVSVTRVRGKAVVLMIEGPYRLFSQTGREQETTALRAQAELFLGSVR